MLTSSRVSRGDTAGHRKIMSQAIWEMANENEEFLNHEVLLSHKEEWNYAVGRKIDRSVKHDTEWNKSSSKSQISHVFAHMRNVGLK
jgi:hypothetical protein